MSDSMHGQGRISIEVNAKELEHLIDILAGVERGANAAGDAITERLEKRAVGAKVANDAKVAAGGMNQLTGATNAAGGSFDQLSSTLPRARYALYDVARTYTMVSTAALGAATAVTAVGVSFQTSFAQVQRTTGVTGAAVGQLRTDLEDLTTVIPESFSNVADIAALGGQLGIAADGITDFTEVTAKLTATTDLSADAAGTALGRFQALLGVPSSEFENLASSILKVGINSVATETQIVQIATQISSMGDFAGLTADQVVGLAGALASTGTQPELARGTVTRLFTLMSKAVGEAGDQLDEFARVSRVSAADFQRAWGTSDFANIFQRFLQGLNAEGKAAIDTLNNLPEGTIEAAESFDDLGLAGTNVVQTLNDLGITSVRDVPALLRLAGAGEVVGNAFTDAASGFADATELNEQYAIIAETLAAKLSTLGNTFKAIMANIADTETLGILGGILSAVQWLAEAFLEISRNPVAKVVMGVVTGVTALIGVLAAVRAAQMMFTASLYAMVTAQQSLAATANVAGVSIRQLGINMFLTGNASRAAAGGTALFAGALRGLLISTGVGAALVALGLAVEHFSVSAKTASQRAEEIFGGSAALADAIKTDTDAVREGAEAIGERTISLGDNTEEVNANKQAVADAAGGQTALGEAVADTTEDIEAQTVALGENLRATLVSGLMGDDAFSELWAKRGTLIEETGFKLDEWLDKAMEAEGGGEAYLMGFITDLESQWTAAYNLLDTMKADQETFSQAEIVAQQAVVDSIRDRIDSLNMLREATTATDAGIADAINSAELLAKFMGYAAESTEDLAEKQKQLAQDMLDAANAIWAQVDATVALENSMFSLGASIAENGLDFSTTTEAGRANLGALGQTINLLTTQADGDVKVLANSIAGLMQALGAMGVDVATDLAFLGQMVAELGGATGAGGLNTAMLEALRSMERGFGSVVPKAVNRTRDSVKQVQKELRTTTDYASDLATLFRDAFRFRFGEQNAKDRTKQLWQDMKDQIKDAKNRAKELRLEIQSIRAAQASLQSRRALLLYKIEIDRMYGNELGVQAGLAELGEIDSDIADNKKDLKDATKELKDVQDELTLSLEGNSDAAREQRERVQELLESYAAQMEEAARNGASQEELKKLSEKLKGEFEEQAEKIGLSKEELEKYSGAFDDMTEIVEEVPRDVTTKWKADASPAEKALANFKAKMDKERAKIEKPFKLKGTFDSKINSNITGLKAAQQALAEALKAQAKAYKNQPGGGTQVDYWDNKVNYWRRQLAQYKGYAEGGFTGRGGKYESAGTVHRGEFVFPQSMVNQNTGLPYANVLGSMAHAMGAMGGGGNGTDIQLVELLPNQLDQLARAVSARVSIDGRVVASVSNGYNSAQQARGAG